MTNIAMVITMAHRNRWFTVLKNGWIFHGKLLVINPEVAWGCLEIAQKSVVTKATERPFVRAYHMRMDDYWW